MRLEEFLILLETNLLNLRLQSAGSAGNLFISEGLSQLPPYFSRTFSHTSLLNSRPFADKPQTIPRQSLFKANALFKKKLFFNFLQTYFSHFLAYFIIFIISCYFLI